MTSEGSKNDQLWSVYLVQCADGSLYTGIAKDVGGRVSRHNQGAGAKYTRGRGPVELVYSEAVGTGVPLCVVNTPSNSYQRPGSFN